MADNEGNNIWYFMMQNLDGTFCVINSRLNYRETWTTFEMTYSLTDRVLTLKAGTNARVSKVCGVNFSVQDQNMTFTNYIYTCIYIYMYIHVHVYILVDVYTLIYTYIYIYVYIYNISKYMYSYLYVCIILC